MSNPFRATIRQLTADVSDYHRRIVETEKLISALRSRSDGEPATEQRKAPKLKRRRLRARGRKAKATRRKRRTIADATPDPPPAVTAAPARAVRGATLFGEELKAVDEILASLKEADKAHSTATRAKDAAGIAAMSERIQGLRRQGGELLLRLNGKAKLPAKLDVVERRRWRAAAEKAAAMSASKPKQRRPVMTPPLPPTRTDSGWRTDESGNLTREIVSA
jgi:hypothetical protein